MKKDKAMRWPYGIALSFVLIIGLIYGTIVVSLDHPVEPSDDSLQNYHVYDKNVNDFIQQRIEFDKLYDLAYISEPLSVTSTVLKYRLTDKAGQPVNNATIEAVITRPDTRKHDIALQQPKVADGVYAFEAVSLPKEGRWNIIAGISVGEHKRYLQFKADTRNTGIFEY